MSRIDEILAKQKALADELEMAKQEERDAVLAKLKADKNLSNWTTFNCYFQPLKIDWSRQ